MSVIDSIVEVSISRQTTQVDMESFDIPLILVEISNSLATVFTDRVRTYSDLEGVAEDLGVDHVGYLMASKLLGGDLKPSSFKIGVKLINESYTQAVNACLQADDKWYALLSDANGDDEIYELANFIQSQRKMFFTSTDSALALNTSQTPTYSAVVNVGDLGAGVVGDKISLVVNGRRMESTFEAGTPDAWGDFVNSETLEVWTSDFTVLGGVLTLNSTEMFSITSGFKSIGLTPVVTDFEPENIGKTTITGMDIGQKLRLMGMTRTSMMFSRRAFIDYPEVVWVGGQLPEIPGSNTWEYKSLPGVMVDKLTDNQISLLEGRGYNYYIPVKGVNITRRGKVAEGEWNDVIILVDWLHARMQEQIFFRLINSKKIPLILAA